MKHSDRFAAPVLALALAVSAAAPAGAFLWFGRGEPRVADFSKQAALGQSITFSAADFVVEGDGELVSITVSQLPDPSAGLLAVGDEPVAQGGTIQSSALDGLRFLPMETEHTVSASFSFVPNFSSGEAGPQATVLLELLPEGNDPPIARNMELSTYKNIAITSWFDAMDGEGDVLTYQLTSTPARGSVELSQDGSSRFVYTPYENKTGKDSFTYVAIDSLGNTSPEARVSISIEKPDTKVTYQDMEGDPAHKSAVRLAEEGIFVGEYLNGGYHFDPDAPVTRCEFLSMAMAVAGLDPLEEVSLTGFSDDAAIPTWAKGYVSSALMAGAIQGGRNEQGEPVFDAQDTVTMAQATVMLNSLLQVTDVPADTQTLSADGYGWAAQAAANLSSAGVLPGGDLPAPGQAMTRGQVAQLLDGALDLVEQRDSGGWPW